MNKTFSQEKAAVYFRLIRVRQYLKNFFIFLPIFFGLKFFDFNILAQSVLAFIFFSMIASAVYIFNDIYDIEEDRSHPQKRHRPIASGKISRKEAVYIAISLVALGLCGSLFLGLIVFLLFVAYLFLNYFYSVKLKHLSIIDGCVVALGFVIRLYIGSFVSNVPLSMWIILTTFLLALFIALAKRRDDVLIYLKDGIKTRKNLDGYNLDFLNYALVMMSSVMIVVYVMYIVSLHIASQTRGDLAYLTVVFALLGILRYLQIIFVDNDAGSPTEILIKDRFIQACIAVWLILFAILLYF